MIFERADFITLAIAIFFMGCCVGYLLCLISNRQEMLAGIQAQKEWEAQLRDEEEHERAELERALNDPHYDEAYWSRGLGPRKH